MYSCSDRACVGVYLCAFCHLMGFCGVNERADGIRSLCVDQSVRAASCLRRTLLRRHCSSHRVERHRFVGGTGSAPSVSVHPPSLPADSSGPSGLWQLSAESRNLNAVYYNSDSQVLVIVPPLAKARSRSPAPAALSAEANQALRVCSLFNSADGTHLSVVDCVSRGSCFTYDAHNGLVWAFCNERKTMERWEALAVTGRDLPRLQIEDESLHPARAAQMILANLDCYGCGVGADIWDRALPALKKGLDRLLGMAQDALNLLRLSSASPEADAYTERGRSLYASVAAAVLRVLQSYVRSIRLSTAAAASVQPSLENLRALLDLVQPTIGLSDSALADAENKCAFPREVMISCCDLLEASFELVWPSWEQRITVISRLLHAERQGLGDGPLRARVTHSLSARYQQIFNATGSKSLASVTLNSELDVCGQHPENLLNTLLAQLLQADVANALSGQSIVSDMESAATTFFFFFEAQLALHAGLSGRAHVCLPVAPAATPPPVASSAAAPATAGTDDSQAIHANHLLALVALRVFAFSSDLLTRLCASPSPSQPQLFSDAAQGSGDACSTFFAGTSIARVLNGTLLWFSYIRVDALPRAMLQKLITALMNLLSKLAATQYSNLEATSSNSEAAGDRSAPSVRYLESMDVAACLLDVRESRELLVEDAPTGPSPSLPPFSSASPVCLTLPDALSPPFLPSVRKLFIRLFYEFSSPVSTYGSTAPFLVQPYSMSELQFAAFLRVASSLRACYTRQDLLARLSEPDAHRTALVDFSADVLLPPPERERELAWELNLGSLPSPLPSVPAAQEEAEIAKKTEQVFGCFAHGKLNTKLSRLRALYDAAFDCGREASNAAEETQREEKQLERKHADGIPSANDTQSARRHHFWLHPDHLSLDGFLRFCHSECLSSPRRVLLLLRTLEVRYQFAPLRLASSGSCPGSFVFSSAPLPAVSSAAVLAKGKTALEHLLAPLLLAPADSAAPLWPLPIDAPPSASPVVRSSADHEQGSGPAETAAVPELTHRRSTLHFAVLPEVVVKLINSFEWCAEQADARLHSSFLQRFVHHPFVTVSQGVGATASTLATTSPSAAASAAPSATAIWASSDPSQILSVLFQRCLADFAGERDVLSSMDIETQFRTEKTFAATLLKHNRLAAECMEFSKSFVCMMLVVDSLEKGVKPYYHPSCPSWFKNTVSAVYRHVRSPILTTLKGLRVAEQEEVAAECAALEKLLADGRPRPQPHIPPSSSEEEKSPPPGDAPTILPPPPAFSEALGVPPRVAAAGGLEPRHLGAPASAWGHVRVLPASRVAANRAEQAEEKLPASQLLPAELPLSASRAHLVDAVAADILSLDYDLPLYSFPFQESKQPYDSGGVGGNEENGDEEEYEEGDDAEDDEEDDEAEDGATPPDLHAGLDEELLAADAELAAALSLSLQADEPSDDGNGLPSFARDGAHAVTHERQQKHDLQRDSVSLVAVAAGAMAERARELTSKSASEPKESESNRQAQTAASERRADEAALVRLSELRVAELMRKHHSARQRCVAQLLHLLTAWTRNASFLLDHWQFTTEADGNAKLHNQMCDVSEDDDDVCVCVFAFVFLVCVGLAFSVSGPSLPTPALDQAPVGGLTLSRSHTGPTARERREPLCYAASSRDALTATESTLPSRGGAAADFALAAETASAGGVSDGEESEELSMMRTFSTPANANAYNPSAPDRHALPHGPVSAVRPSCLSSRFLQPVESDWLAELMRSAAPLDETVRLSIERVRTASSLRLHLVQCLVAAMQNPEVPSALAHACSVDHLLPVVWKVLSPASHAHVLHPVSLRAPGASELLSVFYCHLARTVQDEAALLSASAGPGCGIRWLRVKRALHFFTLDFHPQDFDVLVTSAALPALLRLIHVLDGVIESPRPATAQVRASCLVVVHSKEACSVHFTVLLLVPIRFCVAGVDGAAPQDVCLADLYLLVGVLPLGQPSGAQCFGSWCRAVCPSSLAAATCAGPPLRLLFGCGSAPLGAVEAQHSSHRADSVRAFSPPHDSGPFSGAGGNQVKVHWQRCSFPGIDRRGSFTIASRTFVFVLSVHLRVTSMLCCVDGLHCVVLHRASTVCFFYVCWCAKPATPFASGMMWPFCFGASGDRARCVLVIATPTLPGRSCLFSIYPTACRPASCDCWMKSCRCADPGMEPLRIGTLQKTLTFCLAL